MNRVQRKLAAVGARPLLGASMCRHDPDFVELAAILGYNAIWVDMEHSPVSYREAADLCRLAYAFDMVSMVRIPNADRDHVLRGMECGPDIIDVPMANSPEVARALVEHGRYAPQGNRGYFGALRSTRFGTLGDPAVTHEQTNEAVCLMIQIETIQAVEQARELCQVPGIDAILIGPGDLSVTMGITGQLDNPELFAAADRAVAAAKEAGKLIATTGPIPLLSEWVKRGIDLYFIANDLACLRAALERAMDEARTVLQS